MSRDLFRALVLASVYFIAKPSCAQSLTTTAVGSTEAGAGAYPTGSSGSAVCPLNSTICIFSGEHSLTAAEDHAISNVTASFTFDATMQMRVADATTAAIVGTLPVCNPSTNGRQYTLAKADTTANAVSFAPNGTDKITGTNANLSVGSSAGSSVTLQCNGNASGVTAGWWRR